MYSVLFSGHMIDSPGRAEARFPPSKEQAVTKAVRNVLLGLRPGSVGLAGGACGGDIIFHEQCVLLNIPTRLYLAFPPEEFAERSVKFAGADWEQRFRKLINTLPVYILPEGYQKEIDSVYVRTNIWLVDNALNLSPNISLIALWDGKRQAEKKGGTDNMVDLVTECESILFRINIADL